MQKRTTCVVSLILTFLYHFEVFTTLNFLIPLINAHVVKVTQYKQKNIGYYTKLIFRKVEFNLPPTHAVHLT